MMNTNYINLKRGTDNAKRYVLYLDYDNMLILVNITDMWYIYIDDYLLEHLEITDGLLYTLGGILGW